MALDEAGCVQMLEASPEGSMSDLETPANARLVEAASAAAAGEITDPAQTLVVDPRVYIADLDPAAVLAKMMANRWTAMLVKAGGTPSDVS